MKVGRLERREDGTGFRGEHELASKWTRARNPAFFCMNTSSDLKRRWWREGFDESEAEKNSRSEVIVGVTQPLVNEHSSRITAPIYACNPNRLVVKKEHTGDGDWLRKYRNVLALFALQTCLAS